MGFWLFSFHVKRGAEIKLFHVKHRLFMLILAVSTGVLADFSLAFVHYNTLLFNQIWRCFSLAFSFLVLILALKPLIYLNSLPALQPHHKLVLLIFRLQLIPPLCVRFYNKLYTLQMRPPIAVSGYA